MGLNVSRQQELAENEYLQRFVGKDHIPVSNDEFWNVLLQFHLTLPTNSQDQLNLDSRLESLCQNFVAHNLSTGNFGSLIAVFFQNVQDLLALGESDCSHHAWQTFNALFMIRTLTKYLIETSSEYQLMQHFEAVPVVKENDSNSSAALNVENENGPTLKLVDGTRFETFYDSLVKLLALVPIKDHTYHLHLEIVNTIIVLLSVHLFSPQPTDRSTIFKTVYKSPYGNTLMSVLLHFISRMTPVPQAMFGMGSGASIIIGIADSLWSLLTFSRRNPDILASDDLLTAFREHYPLANQSLLLTLVLINHNTTKENMYREALFACTNAQEPLSAKSDGGATSFRIDFAHLYNTLCRIVTIDQATLLLYILLHRNEQFYKFVIQQPNIEQLVTPILHTLYNGPDSTAHHIYMSLIVLLILSEDDGFNKKIHQIMLKNITWYTEKYLTEISLGGLLILVVIRTIQYNMLKTRDKYLHTNCLAALANMSAQFRSLHPYVSQRLISLFETLARKHSRLHDQLKDNTPTENGSEVNINISTSSSEDMVSTVIG